MAVIWKVLLFILLILTALILFVYIRPVFTGGGSDFDSLGLIVSRMIENMDLGYFIDFNYGLLNGKTHFSVASQLYDRQVVFNEYKAYLTHINAIALLSDYKEFVFYLLARFHLQHIERYLVELDDPNVFRDNFLYTHVLAYSKDLNKSKKAQIEAIDLKTYNYATINKIYAETAGDKSSKKFLDDAQKTLVALETIRATKTPTIIPAGDSGTNYITLSDQEYMNELTKIDPGGKLIGFYKSNENYFIGKHIFLYDISTRNLGLRRILLERLAYHDIFSLQSGAVTQFSGKIFDMVFLIVMSGGSEYSRMLDIPGNNLSNDMINQFYSEFLFSFIDINRQTEILRNKIIDFNNGIRPNLSRLAEIRKKLQAIQTRIDTINRRISDASIAVARLVGEINTDGLKPIMKEPLNELKNNNAVDTGDLDKIEDDLLVIDGELFIINGIRDRYFTIGADVISLQNKYNAVIRKHPGVDQNKLFYHMIQTNFDALQGNEFQLLQKQYDDENKLEIQLILSKDLSRRAVKINSERITALIKKFNAVPQTFTVTPGIQPTKIEETTVPTLYPPPLVPPAPTVRLTPGYTPKPIAPAPPPVKLTPGYTPGPKEGITTIPVEDQVYDYLNGMILSHNFVRLKEIAYLMLENHAKKTRTEIKAWSQEAVLIKLNHLINPTNYRQPTASYACPNDPWARFLHKYLAYKKQLGNDPLQLISIENMHNKPAHL